MKKNNIIISSILLLTFLLSSCGDKPGNQTNFKTHYSIMVLSDVHISSDETKDNRLTDIINAINEGQYLKLDLLVMTGDNVSSFYRDRNKGDSFKNNRAAKLFDIMTQIEIPYYLALGNHDYKIDSDKDSDAPFSFEEIDTMEVLWNKFAGIRPYYFVNHKGWKLIMLNSMRGRYLERAFDDEQMSWLENELKEGKPTLLFFHHPIETDNFKIWCKPKDLISPEKEPEFFKLTEKYENQIKGIFVGHGHMWQYDKLYKTIPVYETDSFADNEDSPFHLVEIDTTSKLINVSQHEFIVD